MFSLELQHDRRHTFTLPQCEAMAKKYGIEGGQVIDLLNFLHIRLGVIQFINIEGVKPIILKKPETLFNKVTDLVSRTFPQDALTTLEYKDFEKKGILPASAFDCPVSIKDYITGKEFIKILKHYHIITPILGSDSDEEEKYFIPCVLNHVPQPKENEQNESEIMPLAIKFKCKHCPKGLFGVLITYLMADHPTFQLNQDKIFKDQISLNVQFPGVQDEISLKVFSSHFQITVFPELPRINRRTPLSNVCCNVREKIEEAIFKSINDLHYRKEDVIPQFCLKCHHCSELHKVDGDVLHCSKDRVSRKRTHIPEEGKYWFIKGQ